MAQLNPKDLLLAPRLEPHQVVALLSPYGFKEIKKADTNLQLMADEPRTRELLSEIIEELLDCLSRSPDPDQALNYFERFIKATYNKTHLFSYLKTSPYTLWLLAKLLASSPFLSEILIRNPAYLYWIADPQTLEDEKPKATLARELSAALQTLKTKERKLRTLCLFKRKELLRIGVRDLLKKSTVQKTTAALSILAETILQKVYQICEESLRCQYGIPLRRGRSKNKRRAPFTILGMGKLGGGELNFSSDVDLIYLYGSAEGATSGARSGDRTTRIPNREYFKRLSQEITSALSGLTNEGYLYRVDLRLRPEGRSGEIAYPLKAYLQYYKKRGETWERLALLKARPVAGNDSLGRQFLKRVSTFIYRQPFSLKNLEEVKILKERIDRKIRARREIERNVKLGMGGIREIEFIVQSIQILFGGKLPQVRERNTLRALKKLLRGKRLTQEEYRQLTEAYIFLRNVEHSLQMVHELQTHSFPDDPEGLRSCVLRLDYRDTDNSTATDLFLREYRLHTGRVNRIFRDLFHTPQSSPILRAALKRTHQTLSKRLAKK